MTPAQKVPATRRAGRSSDVKRCKPLPAITWTPAVDKACRLSVEADIELQLGHHDRAEYLAGRAMALRGWA